MGLYVNTLEYTELLNGSFLIGCMEVRYSLLYYVLLTLVLGSTYISGYLVVLVYYKRNRLVVLLVW